MFLIALAVLSVHAEQLTYYGILNFTITSVKILFNVSAVFLSLATSKFSTTDVILFNVVFLKEKVS